MSKMTASGSAKNNTQEERSNAQFPWKLHELLTQAEKNGNDSIISWLPGTDAFKVHNKQKFATDILPTYFNATKYKSFQRNLNLWGFETITEGPNKGGCYHSLFKRNNKEKCHYMTRQKVKGSKVKEEAPSSPQSNPEVTSSQNNESDDRSVSVYTGFAAAAASASMVPAAESSTIPCTRQAPVTAMEAQQNSLKQLPFPRKLHHFLSTGEYDDCVSWTPDGRCIRIIDPFRFQERVAPKYFSHSSFSSFLVELESYGFKKISHEGFEECFYHDMIIRGCSHLCKYISTPEAAKRFISENPRKDLESDVPSRVIGNQSDRPETTTTAATSSATTTALTSNLAHLAGLLPGLLPSELSLLQQQQQHAHQQQRQSLAGLDPLLQYIQGGHHNAIPDSASQSLQHLRSLTNSILGSNRRSSLTSPPPNPLIAAPPGSDNHPSRSAIAAFLSSRSSGGDDVFRGNIRPP